METLIQAGGVYNLAFAAFHLMFWRLFHWKRDLRSLSYLNRQTVQVLNLCLTLVLLLFAYLSLAHTAELLSSALGRSLLVGIALFWLARAVEQVVFYKLRHWGSWLLLAVFVLGVALYGIPALGVGMG